MNRWDIINHFIKKNNYKTYLEIGYYKGWSFDQVHCKTKRAVDPNPCKNISQEHSPFGSLFQEGDNYIHKVDSDTFFQMIDKEFSHKKWDIIFIDGLHEANQVMRDAMNSLKYLSNNGVIVFHDCNPPKYEHTTTGIDGCWTGDVYKTAIRLVNNPDYDFYTIDTDWGVGVMRPVKGMHVNGSGSVDKYINNWNLFDENRNSLLNLISVEEFLERERYGLPGVDMNEVIPSEPIYIKENQWKES